MNVIIRFIIWIKRLFRGRKQRFEVWDTSAISIWLDRLQERIVAENNLVIVVPEVVINQLSNGRHKFERARKAHKYLLDCESNKLRFAVISSKNRTLNVDEQIMSVVEEYYNKGYNVTLVTCNRSQAFNAELRKFNCLLFEGNKTSCVKNSLKDDHTQKNQKARTSNMASEEMVCDINEEEKQVKCKRVGKDTYIYTPPGVTIYDSKGKKRIGKNGKTIVRLAERVKYDDVEYIVQSITETNVILKRM